MQPLVELRRGVTQCENLVGGQWQPAQGDRLDVRSPYTGHIVASLRTSTAADVDAAVRAATQAWPAWRSLPMRDRVEMLLRFRARLLEELDGIAHVAAAESGKTPAEARAGLLRGIEVIDFAAALPNADWGGSLEVSRGVQCEYRREPLGVVAGIAPFNFPAMVPLWMFPIALTTGNVFVLKPSEKVPMTACRLAALMLEAGYPPGVFSLVHGDRNTVEALTEHGSVRAVAFVGSTPVAQAVYARAAAHGKRALCLGGAKNPLIVAPDADPQLTVRAVVDSFTGCAGQRCMAGSLLIVVEEDGRATPIVDAIVAAAADMRLGTDMGALIDGAARQRLVSAIAQAEAEGAVVRVDGRRAAPPPGYESGCWLGPTVLDRVQPGMACAVSELFGPVLSVVRVPTLDAAMKWEATSAYGNAVSIFTTSGAVARYVSERATGGMVGINVGVPVPREPFSFGGTKASKFGHGDITGPGGVEFWTDLKKITTKWALQPDATWMS